MAGSIRVALALIATCAALVASLLLAERADAGVYTFRIGVVDADPPKPEEIREMGRLGVNTLRVPFYWSRMADHPSQPPDIPCSELRFPKIHAYDALVLQAGRAGMNVLPVLIGSPPYIKGTGGKGGIPPYSQARDGGDYRDFACWVRTLVQRYGYGGTFSSMYPEADKVGEWQIWNEPNLKIHGPYGKVNPTEYARLVKVATNNIRAVNATATTVLAGMPEAIRDSYGIGSREFLYKFYKFPRIKRKFDVLAMHPYGSTYKRVKGVLERTRDLLRDVGDARRALWVTETGYATDGYSSAGIVKSFKGQADELERVLKMMRNNRDRFRLGLVNVFSWRDFQPPGASKTWGNYAGLYKYDGRPKPACYRYVKFTPGAASCRSIPESTTSSTSTLNLSGQAIADPALAR